MCFTPFKNKPFFEADELNLVDIIAADSHNHSATGAPRTFPWTKDQRGLRFSETLLMAEIRFSFNAEKLVHALAFFSRRDVPNLTKLKAAKLLYYADKEHLLKHGRPILGDVYFCLRYGPVPSVALNEMTDAIQRPEVDDADVRQDRDAFSQVVRVHKRLLGGNPVFQAKAFDPEVFSESELEALGEVATCYGRFTAAQLVDLTHKEPTWTIPNQHRTPEGRAPIPYELFFVGAPEESQRILEVLRAEQEDMRELDDIFSARRSALSAL